LAAVPVFVYAAAFVLVNLAYIPFEWHALASAPVEEMSARTQRFAKIRSLFTLGTFVIAMPVALKFPSLGFGLICCTLLVYLRPEPPGAGNEGEKKVTASGAGPSQAEQDGGPESALEI
jgi:TMEM175 potassium channel family protein